MARGFGVKVNKIEVIDTSGEEVRNENHMAFAPMDTTERQYAAVLRYVKKKMNEPEVHTITIKLKWNR